MDLAISRISAEGDETREYVYVRVLRDCDVGAYILADTTYEGHELVSNRLRNVFWFPDKRVRAGDAVVVRTGPGIDNISRLKSGGTLHRFYWNLNRPVWNDEGDAAVLIKVETWSFQAVSG